MTEEKFTEDLHKESEIWAREGLISADQRQRLLARYGATVQASPGRQKLTATIATLGALLVGVGVILFFASNWEKISPFQKMALLMAALLGSYAVGYRLSTKQNGYPRIGRAFYFLGAVLYGSNIFLVAQAYNIRAHWPNGVLWWGLGTLPLAFILSSKAVSTLAVVSLSFWVGSELSLSFSFGSSWGYGLAYSLWGGGLLGVGLWLESRSDTKEVASVFQKLGLFFVLAGLYIFTFRERWSGSAKAFLSAAFDGKGILLKFCFGSTLALILSVVATYLKTWDQKDRGLILWTLGAGAWAWFSAFFFHPGSLVAAVFGNIVYFAGIISLLFSGYITQRAFCINLGLLAFAALVIARYFDFAWRYMERSAAFIVGGLLLLLMGFALERGRRRLLGGMAMP